MAQSEEKFKLVEGTKRRQSTIAFDCTFLLLLSSQLELSELHTVSDLVIRQVCVCVTISTTQKAIEYYTRFIAGAKDGFY